MSISGLSNIPRPAFFYVLIKTLVLATLFNQNLLADGRASAFSPPELASSQHWQRLLHYEDGRSEVVSSAFFLADNGDTDPYAELLATLDAFAQPLDEFQPDEHPVCRFPARYRWLQSQGANMRSFDSVIVGCPEFQHWSDNGNLNSASVVFATGYLGNPASYYGHLLLKFSSAEVSSVSDLLATSVNFGARIPDQENPVTYIFRGLFGGYTSTFSHAYYYENRELYGDEQLRDLWGYELNLNEDEVAFLASHVWELIGQEFDYYFTLENCAYRVARILELITEEPIINERSPWAVPITVFQALADQSYGDDPLVREIELFPSRQRRFYEKYADLNQSERSATRALLDNDFMLTDSEPYQGLSDIEKTRVVMALLDYLEYLRISEDGAETDSAASEYRRRLLVERLNLGDQDVSWSPVREQPPHLGNPPSILGFGYMGTAEESYLTLRGRATSHDMLSLPAGRVPYSALTMLDLELRFDGEMVSLNYFEPLRIETLGISETGLPGDRSHAWRIRAVVEPALPGCSNCTTGKLQGGLGRGVRLGNLGAFYGFSDLHLQYPEEHGGVIGGSASVGFVTQSDAFWAARIETGGHVTFDDIEQVEPFIRVQQRFGNRPGWDIRVDAEHRVDSQVNVRFNYYW